MYKSKETGHSSSLLWLFEGEMDYHTPSVSFRKLHCTRPLSQRDSSFS